MKLRRKSLVIVIRVGRCDAANDLLLHLLLRCHRKLH